MIFDELKRLDFRGMRFYETPDKNHYASITTVLGQTIAEEKQQSLKNWQNSLGTVKAENYTKAAANRGTNVHLMIERYLKNEDVKEKDFSNADVNSFKALKLKLNKITDIIGQEVSLYSDSLEVAGTCDCIANYKGILSIIDFKTSSRIKSEKDIEDYKLQCSFYAAAFIEQTGIDIDQGVILMTADNGFPIEFIFTISDKIPDLIERIDKFYNELNSKL